MIQSKKYGESGEYSIYRDRNTTNYWTLQCEVHPLRVVYDIWIIGCFGFAVLAALATFIVYSVVPEPKNLSRLIVRRYLASYLGCLIPVATFMTLYKFGQYFDITRVFQFILSEFVAQFLDQFLLLWKTPSNLRVHFKVFIVKL